MNQVKNEFNTGENSQLYIDYLQNILNINHVSFLSETEFLESTKNLSLKNEHEVDSAVISQSTKIEENINKYGLSSNIAESLNGRLLERYSRQMLLKEIAYKGQLKVVNAKLALIGSGGIGCPLALYLAGAGVGTIGLFDSDTIEVTNLHRQIAHKNRSLGMKKTESLKNSILEFNPNINVKIHEFVTLQNMHELSEYDFVIDGSDNPQCRYIVNDYCMRNDKKLLSGACIGWEGQVTCYGGKNAPCYRCIWGNQQKTSGGCSALGVVGMLPGTVGLILATEALKLIINGKSSLEGSLLTFECREMSFRKAKIRQPLKDCIGCGENKLNMFEYDYSVHALCASNTSPLPKVEEISWEQYLEKQISGPILDVRPSNHFNICHLNNMINLPYEELSKMNEEKITEWLQKNFKNQEKEELKNNEIYISCNRGISSKRACPFIEKAGYKAISIVGGITEYSKKIDSQIPIL